MKRMRKTAEPISGSRSGSWSWSRFMSSSRPRSLSVSRGSSGSWSSYWSWRSGRPSSQ
jgi:hypothetical protein